MNDATFPASSAAGRATGAMFLGFFGGLWLALWSHERFEAPAVAYAVICIATLACLVVVWRLSRMSSASGVREVDAARRRQSRRFAFVNAVQWVLLLVVGNVLANVGLMAWVVPAAIFIIGAHFIPLATLFRNRAHVVTGLAMMLLAVGYPFLSRGGPSDPVGCLGTGLVLWASAAWAIGRARSATRATGGG